ncbi:MAG: hypothetical protein ACK5NG_09925 [Chthoniobacterales bacterium]
MMKNQKFYDEKEAFKMSAQSKSRRRKILEKQAATLGFTLQPITGSFIQVSREHRVVQNPGDSVGRMPVGTRPAGYLFALSPNFCPALCRKAGFSGVPLKLC